MMARPAVGSRARARCPRCPSPQLGGAVPFAWTRQEHHCRQASGSRQRPVHV